MTTILPHATDSPSRPTLSGSAAPPAEGSSKVRVLVGPNRPTLKAFYEAALGPLEHQVLEALWDARLAKPLFNHIPEGLIVEKAKARGVPPQTTKGLLVRLRSMGALRETNMVRENMGIDMDPLPAHVFPQTVAELERALRRHKAPREEIVGMRERTYIAGVRRHAEKLRALLAPEVHPLIDAMEHEQVARISGPAYLQGVLDGLTRPSSAPTLHAAFARLGWKAHAGFPDALVDEESVMAVGPPKPLKKLAALPKERHPEGRIEAIWQLDIGHVALVRSAEGTTLVGLERLALLVHALPPGKKAQLRCGQDYPLAIHVSPSEGGGEELALIAPVICSSPSVEDESGAREVESPELLMALNRPFGQTPAADATSAREAP